MNLTLEQYYTGRYRRYLMRVMQDLNRNMELKNSNPTNLEVYDWSQKVVRCLIVNRNPSIPIPPNCLVNPLRIADTLRGDFIHYHTTEHPCVTAYETPYTHEMLLDHLREVLKTNVLRGHILVIASEELREHIYAKYDKVPGVVAGNPGKNCGVPITVEYPVLHVKRMKPRSMMPENLVCVALTQPHELIYKDYDIVLRVDLDGGSETLEHPHYVRDSEELPNTPAPELSQALVDTITKITEPDPTMWENVRVKLNAAFNNAHILTEEHLGINEKVKTMVRINLEEAVLNNPNMMERIRTFFQEEFKGAYHTLLLEAIALLGDGQGADLKPTGEYFRGIAELLYTTVFQGTPTTFDTGDAVLGEQVVSRDIFTELLVVYTKDYYRKKTIRDLPIHLVVGSKLPQENNDPDPINPTTTFYGYWEKYKTDVEVDRGAKYVTVYTGKFNSLRSTHDVAKLLGEDTFSRVERVTFDIKEMFGTS